MADRRTSGRTPAPSTLRRRPREPDSQETENGNHEEVPVSAGVAAEGDGDHGAGQAPAPGKDDGAGRDDAAADDEEEGPDGPSGEETGDAAAASTGNDVTASLEDVAQKSRELEEKVVKRLKAGHNGTNLTAEQMATLVRTLGKMHVFGPMPKGVKREKLWQDAFDDWSKAFPEKAKIVSNEGLKQRVVKAMKVYETIDMTAFFGETGATHYDAGEWQDALDAMAQLSKDREQECIQSASAGSSKRQQEDNLRDAGQNVFKRGRTESGQAEIPSNQQLVLQRALMKEQAAIDEAKRERERKFLREEKQRQYEHEIEMVKVKRMTREVTQERDFSTPGESAKLLMDKISLVKEMLRESPANGDLKKRLEALQLKFLDL